MKIALVRHGEIDENMALCQHGKKQIADLAERLMTFGAKIIYASPYLRAKQSALILSSILKIPMLEHNGFSEIGQQEAWNDMQDRVINAIRSCVKAGNIIIVSHGGPIQVLAQMLAGGAGVCRRGEMIVCELEDGQDV